MPQKKSPASTSADVAPSKPPVPKRGVHARIAEAAGVDKGITPSNWVPLGAPLAGLHLLNWHRAATMMQRLILQTGIARRLHTAIRNYVLGEGIDKTAKALDPKLQPYIECIRKIIADFWEDPRNDLDRQLHDWIFDSSAYGELCLPVITDKEDGTVVLQNLPALWINEVEVSDLDVSTVTKISTAQGKWKENRRYKEGGYMSWLGTKKWLTVIHYDPYRFKQDKTGNDVMEIDAETGIEGPVPNPDYGKLHGQCFYFRVNRTLGAVRGWGDSFSVMDLMQALDQFIFDSMNRLDLQSAVVWDLLVDGSDEDVKAWQDQQLITGSKFFAHNKKITLEPKTAAMKMEEFVSFIRIVRELIAGSVGLPEFAMGYGGDTNVATAQEQTPIMYAEFNNRRTLWESWLRFMLRYVVEQKNKAGMIHDDKGNTRELTKKELDQIAIQVSFKPFDRSDIDKLAGSLGKLADALLALEQGKYLTHETCTEIALGAAAQFGVDTDKAAEETTAAEETGESDLPVNTGPIRTVQTATQSAVAESARRHAKRATKRVPDKKPAARKRTPVTK